jgi:leucyl-tRNA synthetase
LVRDRKDAIAGVPVFKAGELNERAKEVRRIVHRTIERVTRDLSAERCQPNTSIAAQMELVNALTGFVPESDSEKQVCREGIQTLLRLLSPFAPHLTDELNEILGGQGALVSQGWPVVDPAALEENTVELAVQINGKVRGRLTIDKTADQATVLAAAKALDSVKPWLEGKQLKKEVYVPGKIITLVVA